MENCQTCEMRYTLETGETKWETDCENDHERNCEIEYKEDGGFEHKEDHEIKWENQEDQQEMGSDQQDLTNKEWAVMKVNLKQSGK